MTKKEALDLLDNALSLVQTTRKNHQLIIEALKMLSAKENDNDLSKTNE